MSNPLSVTVFNSGYQPMTGGPEWDAAHPGVSATLPASTSTLIAGEHDAIVVDAQFTRWAGERLAAFVKDSGKSPSLVFITHGHGDHYFGAGPTLEAFPGAKLAVHDVHTLNEASTQLTPEVLAIWDSWFEGRYIRMPVVPTVLTGGGDLEIEGHPVHMRTVGHADEGFQQTIVHIPELDTICSGDVAYNNIHMFLYESTPETRAAWIAAMDSIAEFEPRTIITGHSDPDAPDDDAKRILAQSRTYIQDFDKAAANSSSPGEIIDKMMEKYSSYGNQYSLFLAAATQFGS